MHVNHSDMDRANKDSHKRLKEHNKHKHIVYLRIVNLYHIAIPVTASFYDDLSI